MPRAEGLVAGPSWLPIARRIDLTATGHPLVEVARDRGVTSSEITLRIILAHRSKCRPGHSDQLTDLLKATELIDAETLALDLEGDCELLENFCRGTISDRIDDRIRDRQHPLDLGARASRTD